MARQSKIVYDATLSVKENARINNCSEDGIRYYIRTRGIDRRYNEKLSIVNAISEYLQAHPNATKKQAALELPFGINTVRKYWRFANDNLEICPNPNKTLQRNKLHDEELRRRVKFLDAIPIEFLKDYIRNREVVSVVDECTLEVSTVEQTPKTVSISQQYRAVILDFDRVLFNTKCLDEARKAKDWDKVLTLIPQIILHDGWRKFFEWAKVNRVKICVVSVAKSEHITRALKHFDLEVDAIVGAHPFLKKPSRTVVNEAINKMGVLRKNTICVGCTLTDKQMSDNSLIRFVGATWDCEPKELSEIQKGKYVVSPDELIGVLAEFKVVDLPEDMQYNVVKYQDKTSKKQSPHFGEVVYNDSYVYFYQGVCFSNWWNSKPQIEYDGHKFNCSESVFMYLKCKMMGSEDVAIEIVKTDNDDSLEGNAKFGAVKDLGRKAKFKKAIYLEQREEWMYLALKAKFEADQVFRNALMDKRYEGKTFVEAANSDDIWGVGTYITKELLAFNQEVWMGENLLGKALTRLRDEKLHTN